MNRLLYFILAALLMLPITVQAKDIIRTLEGVVVKVSDGNTKL